MSQMLPMLLDWLSHSPDPDVGLLGLRTLATGTHRANTEAELRAMLGDDLCERLRTVNHDARDRDSHAQPRASRIGSR